MRLTEKQFKEYLALYGTEIGRWPEQVRAEAIRAQHHAVLSRLMIEQQYIDEVLLSHRHFEPASPDLAARIIDAARSLRRPECASPVVWIQALLASVLPQPAVALAAMLTLGIAIGFGMQPAGGSDTNAMQAYMGDDGAIL